MATPRSAREGRGLVTFLYPLPPTPSQRFPQNHKQMRRKGGRGEGRRGEGGVHSIWSLINESIDSLYRDGTDAQYIQYLGKAMKLNHERVWFYSQQNSQAFPKASWKRVKLKSARYIFFSSWFCSTMICNSQTCLSTHRDLYTKQVLIKACRSTNTQHVDNSDWNHTSYSQAH